jgi:hypothetical protein
MINPQKGIDLMNNTSIIIRILFAVTIFQHAHLNTHSHNYLTQEEGASLRQEEDTTTSTTGVSW